MRLHIKSLMCPLCHLCCLKFRALFRADSLHALCTESSWRQEKNSWLLGTGVGTDIAIYPYPTTFAGPCPLQPSCRLVQQRCYTHNGDLRSCRHRKTCCKWNQSWKSISAQQSNTPLPYLQILVKLV